MWAQGHRGNPDKPELSASSIGMTVAALQACDGLNLFGEKCSHESALFVDPDAMYRNMDILHNMLPKESKSKDVDAALLTTKGFPAFVVEDPKLCEVIEENINLELLGTHGYKRFIGDEYGVNFSEEAQENEWPYLLLFQMITCIFEGQIEKISKYRSRIISLLYDYDSFPTVPQYCRFDEGAESYIVVKDRPIVVFQSILILTDILERRLIHPSELDNRKLQIPPHRSDDGSVIQIALFSESMSFQGLLSTYGVTTQTPNQIESVFIWPSVKLVDLLYFHGSDPSLGLTGRPKRPLGALCTSRLWKIGGKTVMCVPLFLDKQDFYISKDESYIADSIKIHLKFLRANWRHSERPTFIILLTPGLFKTNSRPLLSVLNTLQSGNYKNILLKVGRLQELMPVARKVEVQLQEPNRIDFNASRILASPTLTRKSLSIKNLQSVGDTDGNIEAKKEEPDEDYDTLAARCRGLSDPDLLALIKSEPPSSVNVISLIEKANRAGPQYQINGEKIEDIIEHYYRTMENDWLALRCAAAFLGRTVDSLAPALSSILVSGRALSLGVHGYPQVLITEPMNPHDLEEILHTTIKEQSITHVSLQQEFLIYLSQMLVDNPEVFKGIFIVRIGSLIQILHTILVPKGMSIENLSPSALKLEIRNFLMNGTEVSQDGYWQRHRLINGMLGRVPINFHARVWKLLHHQKIEFVGKHGVLRSSDGKDCKPTSANFIMIVEHFLDKFGDECRYLVIELMNILVCTIERNAAVNFVERFGIMEFITESGVEDDYSSEELSKKFLNCLIKCEYAKLVDISDCILS